MGDRRGKGRSRGRQVLCAACCLALAVDAVVVRADSFRCGRRVVRTGDTEEAVRARCGEPHRTDRGTEALWLPEGHQRVRVERWYYKGGDRRLERIVLLYRGEVVAVRVGAR